MAKRIRLLIGSGVNVGLIVLLMSAARLFPPLFPLFYTEFSRNVNRTLASVCAVLPFPVWEILLAALLVWQLVSLIRSFAKKTFLDWLCRLPLIVTTLALVFVAIWGLNFFGPGVAEATELEVGQYTQTQLKQALDYYAQQASSYSTKVPRDEAGDLILPDETTLSDLAVGSVNRLAQDNPRFENPAPRVKFLLGSEGFGYMGVTGIYVCLTGESAVSRATHPADIPFTMCHELGHSLCFCAEDEANFFGFLACSASDDVLFRYSGYLSAFRYCYNALYRLDPVGAQGYWSLVSEEVFHDCNAAGEHYRQYDGSVQQAAQSVNDAYLQSFDQEEGVQSYNMVTDLLIAYYLKAWQ